MSERFWKLSITGSPWANQVQSEWVITFKDPRKNMWHAEDGCYFLYETLGKGVGIKDDAQGNPVYPDGSIIATFGDYIGDKGIGKPTALCTDPRGVTYVATRLQLD